MIKIGTDICSLKRIASAYQRFGERFLRRILAEQEMRYVLSQPRQTVARLAGRFAAKEPLPKPLAPAGTDLPGRKLKLFADPAESQLLFYMGVQSKSPSVEDLIALK